MSITFGAETEFLSAGGAPLVAVAALSSTQFVVAYRDDADSGHGTAKVGTVSGTDVTFGAESEFLSAGGASHISAAALSGTQFVVAYRDDSDTYHGTAKVGTVSGTAIAFGAEAEFLSTEGAAYVSVAALSATAFVVAYRDTGSGRGTAKVGTVSGTGIAFGAAAEFLSAFAAVYVRAAALSATAFVVAYRDDADSGHGTARIGTVSGTAITFGAEAEFLSASAASYIFATTLSGSQFVIVYYDSAVGSTTKVGTVSGTAITFGAETVFIAAGTAGYISATALSGTQFVVAYYDGLDSGHGTAKIGTVSGTAITFGAETEFLSAGTIDSVSATALSGTQFVVAYADGADSSHGTAKVGSLPTAWTVELSDSVALADEAAVVYLVAVVSDPSGVPVSASPDDEDGNGNGTTPFSRRYADGTGITLTAPAKSGNRAFLEWRDGGGNTLSSSRTLGVTVAAAGTYTAHYEFAGDSADDYLVASP